MRFDLLGPLRIRTDDGSPVTVREPKVRALLADLLAHHGRPLPADRLVEDLWEDRPPGNPANTLQTKVSQLRRALEQAEPGARALVALTPAGYTLQVADEAVDTGRFAGLTALAEQAHRAGNRTGRARLLGEALALWRGPALAEFRDATFARAVAVRLDEQYLTALEASAEARLDLGQHRELADELAAAVAEHPLRERLRGAHLRALYRAGRQSEALAGFAEIKAQLAEELGLDPGPELSGLHTALLRQDPSLGVPAATAGSAPAPPEHGEAHLPAPVTALVGRAADAARVHRLVRDGRLVTLVGPGGVGKTRLALEVAAQASGDHADGVRFVELTPLAGDLAAAVAAALGLREDHAAGSAADRLARALRARDLLLVLDGCEHLVDQAADLTAHLLRHAPGLRVLATSQEPLALDGESLHLVRPLAESDAIALFTARARAAAPDFALGPATADAVAAICARLDGIPLALELAAARVRALGVHSIAARLDDRFRLLTAGRRDAPARQRTLRAVIDWSWELLGDEERTLLRRLAVFAGGCTADAAQEVCATPGPQPADLPASAVLDTLGRLVDRSLVSVSAGTAGPGSGGAGFSGPDGEDGGPRYRLLESIAAYGLERLEEADETAAVRRRHRTYCTELAEHTGRLLHGPGQHAALDRLDRENPDLCAALGDAVEQRDTALATRLVNALTWYWFLRGRPAEAHHRLTTVLALAGPADAARAAALARREAFALLTGEAEAARGPGQGAGQGAGRGLAPDEAPADAGAVGTEHGDGTGHPAEARARWLLGFARCGFGRSGTGGTETVRLLAEFRRTGDRWGEAAAHATLTAQAGYRGDLPAVRHHATESAALFAELGDGWGRLRATEHLGVLAEIAGDYDRARRLHAEGVRLAEELRLWTDLSFLLSRAGRIALLTGDLDASARLHERARTLAVEQSHRPAQQFADMGLALTARRRGDLEAAEVLLLPWLAWNREQGVDAGTALILAQLGFAAEQRGDAGRATGFHLEGLRTAERTGDVRAVALALEGLAGARSLGAPSVAGSATGQDEQVGHREHAQYAEHAAELLGTAAELRRSVGSPLPAAERFDTDRIGARALGALGAEGFAAAHARGERTPVADHPARFAPFDSPASGLPAR
ncbi:BTAD domain-containing putative transcriptional regulator [Streptomyces sp. BE20]|uniref:BTAD domain-containing putative transcriptional regulator n=1 Tax=Streptomyces sp. BE20 TaxID=3002525 RepID=UPI002E76E750|nr:BTAD domain-containing putative transcriptional regulator [Streptomyces sp. BE20]MEE1821466.1 BTAD domain-containing putative transcriptional regulator [Streptomyces sp. BE20]